MTNKIGYGRPPKHTQFHKGQSGNPRGRPKGSCSLYAEMKESASKKIPVVENGVRRYIAAGEGLIRLLWQMALSGDHRAMIIILKYLLGEPSKDPHHGEGFWIPPGGAKFTLDIGSERDDDEDDEKAKSDKDASDTHNDDK